MKSIIMGAESKGGCMMREIIFRVWDKTCHRYKRFDGMHDTMTISRDGRVEYYNLQNGSGGDEYILEQYTGLKDKNGKMIFEGDILQDDDDIEDDVFHVARIGQSDENRYECFLDFNGDNKCWMPFIRYFNRMEIISNIHDQKEDV